MRSFLILCACIIGSSLALTLDTHNLWQKYKAAHNKVYTRVEEVKRQQIFAHNLQLIMKHNAEADLGLHSFRLGLNKFADLENHEFRRLNGYRSAARKFSSLHANFTHTASRPQADLPEEVDWREKNLVADVKDQGSCGSCWAFSAVASLEGQNAKKTGKLVEFSEQQLVDCSNPNDDPQGNQGCDGGLMDLAFQYIKEAGGIESEQEYPYDAKDETCAFQKEDVVAKVTGFVDIKTGDENNLQDAVANVGPVAVAIDAGSIWFQLYFGGVYDHDDCSSELESLNHGVTAVGYGSEGGKDFWMVKNSWGGGWGDSGYIKMRRNGDNQCGIATAASYPLV